MHAAIGTKLKPDVIHSHDFPALGGGYIIKKATKAKLVYDNHEIPMTLAPFIPSVFPSQKNRILTTLERFLIISPGGPIVVDAIIMLDGKPFRKAREELAANLVKQADIDADGKSTWQEAIDNPRFAYGRFGYNRTAAQRGAQLKRYDFNGNGNVDIAEARYLIAAVGGGAAFNVRSAQQTALRPDIAKILDENSGEQGKQKLQSSCHLHELVSFGVPPPANPKPCP